MAEITDQSLQNKIDELQAENDRLKDELSQKEAEIFSNVRLLAVGESAAMAVHEALNPLTSVSSRLQYLLNEEGHFQLLNFILKDWNKDFSNGGIDKLFKQLSSPTDEGNLMMIEEDLENINKGLEEANNDFEFMYMQLKRVVLILNNLRGLSRVQANLNRIDVKTAIDMTAELINDSLAKRNIKIKIDLKHKSTTLFDENELVQVLHNLTRNAIQALGKNGMIYINSSQNDKSILIHVSDSGEGIKEGIKDKIFASRFTTKNAKEGTGLGLALSKRIMIKAGGDLQLESAKSTDRGATFVVTIPIKTQQ